MQNSPLLALATPRRQTETPSPFPSQGVTLKRVTSAEESARHFEARSGESAWIVELDGKTVGTGGLTFHYKQIQPRIHTDRPNEGLRKFNVLESLHLPQSQRDYVISAQRLRRSAAFRRYPGLTVPEPTNPESGCIINDKHQRTQEDGHRDGTRNEQTGLEEV